MEFIDIYNTYGLSCFCCIHPSTQQQLGRSINAQPLANKDDVAVDIRVNVHEVLEGETKFLRHGRTSISAHCSMDTVANCRRILPSYSNCMHIRKEQQN
ncbi:UNVERIFIED_CONTAM: hypothetical protein Sangu_1001600 [Sesamum angustifolium]|uniref:Uncharacterized protein n=1 Tax=Sesamum angustifolium TaxID=2727405 RepID=A0AAW2PGU6_9LAMI